MLREALVRRDSSSNEMVVGIDHPGSDSVAMVDDTSFFRRRRLFPALSLPATLALPLAPPVDRRFRVCAIDGGPAAKVVTGSATREELVWCFPGAKPVRARVDRHNRPLTQPRASSDHKVTATWSEEKGRRPTRWW